MEGADEHPDPREQRYEEAESREVTVGEARAQSRCHTPTPVSISVSRAMPMGARNQRGRGGKPANTRNPAATDRTERTSTPRFPVVQRDVVLPLMDDAPRCTERSSTGVGASSSSRGRAGTRDRGSVDHRCTESLGALTTSSPASHTAYDAGAPGSSVPARPSRTPPARHAPRVAAENAARGRSRCRACGGGRPRAASPTGRPG